MANIFRPPPVLCLVTSLSASLEIVLVFRSSPAFLSRPLRGHPKVNCPARGKRSHPGVSPRGRELEETCGLVLLF